MNSLAQTQSASISFDAQQQALICRGWWVIDAVTLLQQAFAAISWPKQLTNLVVDGEGVEKLDTAGAWFLVSMLAQLKSQNRNLELKNFSAQQQELIELITKHSAKISEGVVPTKTSWLANLGKQTLEAINQQRLFFTFIGEMVFALLNWLRHPARIQWKLIFNTVESSGYRALPIIGLLVFLIGIVLTYQMGLQLRNFGANIYIVNLIGLSMLREFAPLITAIIIAGRSGSAFTAQLGTMKANEEMDALQTLGIAPIERLVLPRVLGLMIALPLLTVWSDVLGVIGGMVMSKQLLNIHFIDFLLRFQEAITLKTLLIGILKAPVFAMIIASVGCFQGFQVTGSAESVGRLTTRSVVQGIFLIICVDALFSILLSWGGI